MSDLETRNRIIDKASEHFLQFGFSKATMNEIAADLGMSKKTVYAHFASKDELLEAMMNRMNEQAASQIDALVANQEIDFIEKLFQLLNLTAEIKSKVTPHFLLDVRRTAPHICKCTDEFVRNRVETVVARVIREGIEKNVFRQDINERLVVLMYVSAFHTLTRPETLSELPVTTRGVLEALSRVFFGGILTDEARNRIRQLHSVGTVNAVQV